MRFTPSSPLRLEARRAILQGLRYAPSRAPPAAPLCRALARAAAAAAALDAAVYKPPAAGGHLGSPRLTVTHLALNAGVLYEAALYSCGYSLETLDPVASAMAALLMLAGSLAGAEGAAVAVSLLAAALPHSTGLSDAAGLVAEALEADDGVGSALFYQLISSRARSYTPRMLYTLPDAADPSSPLEALLDSIPLAEVLRVAGASAIVYRDVVEGYPRTLDASRLPPDAAMRLVVRLYSGESGVSRRRGCGGADPVLEALRGCTPGDVADLAVAAAYASILEHYPALLEGSGEAVE